VLSHELVLRRLADARPRIVDAVETIVGAMPTDFIPRQSIPQPEVAAVLARPIKEEAL
jgi:5'-methylthioadenosine phosphorylase